MDFYKKIFERVKTGLSGLRSHIGLRNDQRSLELLYVISYEDAYFVYLVQGQ